MTSNASPTFVADKQHRASFGASAAMIAVLTLVAYWNSLANGFVRYDDQNYIFENSIVLRGMTLEGIAWAFMTFHTGNWHPLTWLSHMLDAQLFGVHAAGHHVMNVALHIVNALLLYWLLDRMTRRLWLSAIVAALFALHPLRVESVAWVSERKDLLSVLFGLICIGAYVRYVGRPSMRAYWPVFVLMALSLMAKPMLVTLPALLLLIDFWPLRRARYVRTPMPSGDQQVATWRQLVLEKLPLVALSIACSFITLAAQRSNESVTPFSILPLTERLANAVISYVRYLGKLFWPFDLAVLYPYPLHWPVWQSVGAAVLLAVVTALVFAMSRRKPFLVVGWLWYLIALVPVIGIVQVGAQSMADRYTYMPSIGILVMLVWGLDSVLCIPAMRRVGIVLAAAALVSLTVLTSLQTRVWRDTPTLFVHALQVTDHNHTIMDSLAKTLAEDFPNHDSVLKVKDSLISGEVDAEIYFSLAESFLKRGDLNTAMSMYQQTLERNSDHAQANNNLAWLLATHPQGSHRNAARALQLADRAATLTNRSDAGILDTLAAALAENGRFDDAIAAAQRAHELALAANQQDLASIIDHHLKLFRAGRPVRIPSE